MKKTTVTSCPLCGIPGFEIDLLEIDIGVGTQEHVIGGTCIKCGPMAPCDGCGYWQTGDEKGQGHAHWCGKQVAPWLMS